jgi:hypothetical protein
MPSLGELGGGDDALDVMFAAMGVADKAEPFSWQ